MLTYIIQGLIAINDNNSRCGASFPRAEREVRLIFNEYSIFNIKAKLHMEHPWEGGKKVYINGQGHMTKMATMAINRKKNFKNLLLQNQKANDFETLCEALQSL